MTDTDRSRAAMINITMGMVLACLALLLASCGQRQASDEDSQETNAEQSNSDRVGERQERENQRKDLDDANGRPNERSMEEAPAASPAPAISVAPDRAIVTGGARMATPPRPEASMAAPENRDEFENVDPNLVKSVAEEPVSTFSVDVDTASYSLVRRFLNDNTLPPSDAVRVEEMVNYFTYDYPVPETAASPFLPAMEIMPTPWNADTKLLRIGIKGYDLQPEETPALNLVFLIDVSGSMSAEDKLPLLLQSLGLLVDTLGPEDRVSIAVYAGAAGVVLQPTPGDQKAVIKGALDQLQAGGSTAGGEGIRLAYSLAEQNFEADKINRVILATDGDFNVGITDDDTLEDFVTRKRETGIFLTVMGFGRGNLNDALMQRLVQAGNGQALYIDTIREARRALVDGVRATLFPIAKDVKIQVEFNPAKVAEYRLIGYETRLLDRADFNNDKVDAGEIGSGHSVTAFYELIPVGSPARLIDPRRYGNEEAGERASERGETPTDQEEETGDGAGAGGESDLSSEYAFVRIRYKLPDEDESNLIEQPADTSLEVDSFDAASEDARFAASVAAFGQLLRNDPNLKDMDLDRILEIAIAAKGEDAYGDRAEFTQLVRLAQSADGIERLNRGTAGRPEQPNRGTAPRTEREDPR